MTISSLASAKDTALGSLLDARNPRRNSSGLFSPGRFSLLILGVILGGSPSFAQTSSTRPTALTPTEAAPKAPFKATPMMPPGAGVETVVTPSVAPRSDAVKAPDVPVTAATDRTSEASAGSDLLSAMSDFKWGSDFTFELPFPLENGGISENRVVIREADVHLKANIDSFFESYLNFLAHDDTGSFLFDLREGWVANRMETTGNHRFKLGKFALTIDEVNQMRPWERPFISSPFAQRTFIATNQEVDTGVEYQWRALQSSRLTLNLFAGVTSGYCFGDCTPMSGGERPSVPVYYLHPTSELRGSDSVSRLGVTYLGYSDADSTVYQLFGLDEMWSKGVTERDGFHQPKWMILTEWFYRSTAPSGLSLTNEEGGFLLLQHAFTPRITVGLRVDLYTQPTLRDGNGDLRQNMQTALAPIVTYAISRRTQGRLQYTFNQETEAGSDTRNDQTLEMQFVANLGDRDER